MSHRNDQLDMPHPFTAYFFLRHFHTTTVTNDTFITDAFVFTAMALVILYRTENPLTEQTVAFRLISTVVDGSGFNTCPLECSRISSGEASPIAIFVSSWACWYYYLF